MDSRVEMEEGRCDRGYTPGRASKGGSIYRGYTHDYSGRISRWNILWLFPANARRAIKKPPACERPGAGFDELVDKPGSVVDDHSSATAVTNCLKRPTRIHRGPRLKDSYLVLLRVGFTIAAPVTSRAVRSYRTFSPLPNQKGVRPLSTVLKKGRTPFLGGFLSAALSVGSRPPGVTWHPALWSPDFPPPDYPKVTRSDRLTSSGASLTAWANTLNHL